MIKPILRILDTLPKEDVDFFDNSKGIKIVPQFYNNSEEKILINDSGSFVKWVHKNHAEINIDFNPNSKKIALHNNEFWLPLVHLATDIAPEIFIGLVINFIYDKLKGALKSEEETATVNVTFVYKDGDKFKEFKFKGKVKDLKKLLKKNALDAFLKG